MTQVREDAPYFFFLNSYFSLSKLTTHEAVRQHHKIGIDRENGQDEGDGTDDAAANARCSTSKFVRKGTDDRTCAKEKKKLQLEKRYHRLSYSIIIV